MHACKYDVCIYDAAEILSRTDIRTNGQGDSRSWIGKETLSGHVEFQINLCAQILQLLHWRLLTANRVKDQLFNNMNYHQLEINLK